MHCDLHFHTYYSSDSFSCPEKNVALMAKSGCKGFACTDHNAIDTIPIFRELAPQFDLEYIHGVELNAYHPEFGGLHILAYGFDLDDNPLTRALKQIRQSVDEGYELVLAHHIEKRLIPNRNEFLSWARTPPQRRLGHKQISIWLYNHGKVNSIDDGKALYMETLATLRPVYGVETAEGIVTQNPADIVRQIHDSGGIAVFAHPGKLGKTMVPAVEMMIAAGVDGIEVYTPKNRGAENIETLRQIAVQYRLLLTGGSDYHGPSDTLEAWPSEAPYPCFEALLKALNNT